MLLNIKKLNEIRKKPNSFNITVVITVCVYENGNKNPNTLLVNYNHRNLIYIECSWELVHISAAKTVAL